MKMVMINLLRIKANWPVKKLVMLIRVIAFVVYKNVGLVSQGRLEP
jgi:hypothetical protein